VLFMAVGVKLTLATILDPATPKLRAAPTVPTAEAVMARAPITDRNGEALAVSLRVIELYANPQEIGDPAAAADRLLTVLPDLDRERLIERITPRNVPGTDRPMQFAYIHRNLTPRQTQAVNNLGVPGFHFRPAERRFFPQGSSAAHIIGQVGVEGQGLAGVERSFDQRLRTDPAPLRLSVDIRVQVALRDAVQHAIADFNGIGGAGVIMDVHTGEVIAMISLPDYDASDPMSLVRRPSAAQVAAQEQAGARARRARVAGEENDATFKPRDRRRLRAGLDLQALHRGHGAGPRHGERLGRLRRVPPDPLRALPDRRLQGQAPLAGAAGNRGLLLQHRHRPHGGGRRGAAPPRLHGPLRHAEPDGPGAAGSGAAARALRAALARDQHHDHRLRPRHLRHAAARGERRCGAGQRRHPAPADPDGAGGRARSGTACA
jgi:hypothetical protein